MTRLVSGRLGLLLMSSTASCGTFGRTSRTWARVIILKAAEWSTPLAIDMGEYFTAS
jgi:hypothetical protein